MNRRDRITRAATALSDFLKSLARKSFVDVRPKTFRLTLLRRYIILGQETVAVTGIVQLSCKLKHLRNIRTGHNMKNPK